MNMDDGRLRKLYDEKSDDALLDMWERREDLTDAAQDALAGVMRERKLSTAAPESVEAAHDAASVAAGASEVLLWTFGDMFQARRAIDLLETAQIEYKLNDLSQGAAAASWRGGADAWLQLLVAEGDFGAAKKVLQEGMGLFPPAEGETRSADAGPLDDRMSVLMIDAETELEAGLAAAAALAEKGISFVWHDGRDFPEGLADAHTISIEVRPGSYESAAAVVESAVEALR